MGAPISQRVSSRVHHRKEHRRSLQSLHSTARTYTRMPAAKESGIGHENQHGLVFSISGPVIIAENMIGVAMYELCKVGYDELVGEVIRIEADKATIRCMKKQLVSPLEIP